MDSEYVRNAIKAWTPRSVLYWYRLARQISPQDIYALAKFVLTSLPRTTLTERTRLVRRFCDATIGIDCAHTADEVLRFATAVLTVPPELTGCVVEAGCFKGGGTAKFSVVAKLAGRRMIVFDSFEGLPDNTEEHKASIFGEQPDFSAGKYRGGLEEVRANVASYGELDVCEFRKGWFESTMPLFREPIVAAYLDVDLVSSTRTCLKYLYPLVRPGGYIFSQDGHLPLIIELLGDGTFWRMELSCDPPRIEGLGREKLVCIRKPEAG